MLLEVHQQHLLRGRRMPDDCRLVQQRGACMKWNVDQSAGALACRCWWSWRSLTCTTQWLATVQRGKPWKTSGAPSKCLTSRTQTPIWLSSRPQISTNIWKRLMEPETSVDIGPPKQAPFKGPTSAHVLHDVCAPVNQGLGHIVMPRYPLPDCSC